jgi:hypothetical protein
MICILTGEQKSRTTEGTVPIRQLRLLTVSKQTVQLLNCLTVVVMIMGTTVYNDKSPVAVLLPNCMKIDQLSEYMQRRWEEGEKNTKMGLYS